MNKYMQINQNEMKEREKKRENNDDDERTRHCDDFVYFSLLLLLNRLARIQNRVNHKVVSIFSSFASSSSSLNSSKNAISFFSLFSSVTILIMHIYSSDVFAELIISTRTHFTHVVQYATLACVYMYVIVPVFLSF